MIAVAGSVFFKRVYRQESHIKQISDENLP